MSESFVHLHNHTEYSMLDGAARVKKLIAKAVELGMPAIAMTDHGNTHGAYEFWKQAKAQGIKPIIGIEAYVAPGSRLEKSKVRWADGGDDDVSGGGAYSHMTMWSTDNASMQNLFRLSSEAYLSGYYFKPRMDRELLNKYGKGLIATTGCPGGEVQTRLRLGQYDEAIRTAAEFRDIFGEGNFFVEVMDHGLSIEKRVRDDLLRLAKDLSLPLVATNDLHYTNQEDHEAHDALLCVQVGSNIYDQNRFKFESQEYYLKSAAQMRELFKDLPEAANNTLLIAERSEVNFEKRDLMPRFPVPEGETEADWLAKEVWRGMDRRFPNGYSDKHREQAAYELDVIVRMGFPGYFLVVADFISWARSQGIRVGPGRGSAAGSIVAYALGITELDPLEHDLIFERFLNPERLSMPDIDVDFDDRRRPEVIRYVTEKYGDDRVAQIVTFGTIKAKQALKDAARVLAMPYAVGEKLTKAMPPMVLGRDVSLNELIDPAAERYSEAAEFREIIENDEESKRVFDLAQGLESLKRQWGVHAAGVIMSAEPLMDVIPIMKREEDGAIITQFDQPPCEDLGLLKMDFLGLRNLTVLDDALENIRQNRGESVVLEELDLNADEKTFELLSRGDTLGVFQLDGDAMRQLLRQLKPTEFEHISAVIALYRPGPMGMNSHINYAQRKNGQQQSEPVHPELEEPLREILGPTYGLIVYQEQVMAAAQKVAGYSLGQADLLRRAMGKKKPEELEKQYEIFSAGMQERNYSKDAIKALWETLLPFADYAFNKAHSAGYGVLSYWTAYLKANYPAEYMAALLTSVGDSKDKLAIYLNECRKMGIKVLPPDVSESIGVFAAVGDDIRFGLGAIRNVGKNVVDAIVEARQAGKFTSFHDFLSRVGQQATSKRVVESLIKAGAFDSLGHTRRSLIAIHEEAIDSAVVLKKQQASGQMDLFGDLLEEDPAVIEVPTLPEWTKRDLLSHEREMLGLYVSDHPLAGMEALLMRHSDMGVIALRETQLKDGETVTIAGLITQVAHRVARTSGNPYGQVTLEDFSGEISVMFMGKTYLENRELLIADQTVAIRGRISRRDEEVTLQAFSIEVLDAGREQGGVLRLAIKESMANKTILGKLGEILDTHPGPVEVQVKLIGSAVKHFLLPQRVAVGHDLFGELKALLGPDAVD
ncbi:DNA polymerase III subunit alpha [Aquiluna sp. KACHI24]|uniref:DNA polymerase III subunit alpha n=1 Tax=Aquiluna sp. KACHI24 TaxID=2968831 RepID=UPI0021F9D1FB|nr:DNA polymerase III subunit alpha [Aquiluna sp. KACHI24]BDQ00192.1 DNA polymerase III subunit alpha [Aquiluna sp. KACHI24]